MNNNNMDLEKLSKAVMERIVEEVKGISSGKTTSGSDKLQIDGEPFNPAIHRRFISAQMIRLMEVYHMDYNTAVRNSYDLMYSIKFTIEECKKIAGYKKYNPVAHEERSRCFPLEECKTIFMDYFRKVEAYLLKNDREKYYKRHNCVTRYVKGRGGYQVAGSYNEVIKNGKIVREFVPNESYKKLLDEVEMMKKRVAFSETYEMLYCVMKSYTLISLPNNMYFPLCPTFIEAFKKAGSFFTLYNAIVLNGASYKGMSGRDAVALLRSEINKPGYMIYAALKEEVCKQGYGIFLGEKDDVTAVTNVLKDKRSK